MSKMTLAEIARLVREEKPDLAFTMLEIGARPVNDDREPFYDLLELFPGSCIIAFEVEETLCDELNATAPAGVTYFPVALGRENGTQLFYETVHPMCSSLYQPDELIARSYHNLDVQRLKAVSSIKTTSLDSFMEEQGITTADFIKIDVQGAELDIFQGGQKTVQDTLWIVSEVEFIPLYVNQPLFGDLCQYLTQQGLMFHKFLNLAGRTLKPVMVNRNPNQGTQYMWADTVFMHNVFKLYELTPEMLLKMGVLALLYGSADVTWRCFARYDEVTGRHLLQNLSELAR